MYKKGLQWSGGMVNTPCMNTIKKRERAFDLLRFEAGEIVGNYAVNAYFKNQKPGDGQGDGQGDGRGVNSRPVIMRQENGDFLWCGVRAITQGCVSIKAARYPVRLEHLRFQRWGSRLVHFVDKSKLILTSGFRFAMPLKTKEDAKKLFALGFKLDKQPEQLARMLGWSGIGAADSAHAVTWLIVDMMKGGDFREIPRVTFEDDGLALERMADWPDVARMLGEIRGTLVDLGQGNKDLAGSFSRIETEFRAMVRENQAIRERMGRIETQLAAATKENNDLRGRVVDTEKAVRILSGIVDDMTI